MLHVDYHLDLHWVCLNTMLGDHKTKKYTDTGQTSININSRRSDHWCLMEWGFMGGREEGGLGLGGG